MPGQLRLYLGLERSKNRDTKHNPSVALLFPHPLQKILLVVQMCCVNLLHLKQVPCTSIIWMKTWYIYTKFHTLKATADNICLGLDALTPFYNCSNLHWDSGLCWPAMWSLQSSPSAWWRWLKSFHCIQSFLSLHFFCFWNYSVDCYCWSKTNSPSLLLQSIQQLCLLNFISF